MLNQREEKTGAELSNHGACNLVKWSDFFPVCGKIVVKRKITAKLAVIFLKNGGPDRIRTDDPHNANVVRSQLRYKPVYEIVRCLKSLSGFIIAPEEDYVKNF